MPLRNRPRSVGNDLWRRWVTYTGLCHCKNKSHVAREEIRDEVQCFPQTGTRFTRLTDWAWVRKRGSEFLLSAHSAQRPRGSGIKACYLSPHCGTSLDFSLTLWSWQIGQTIGGLRWEPDRDSDMALGDLSLGCARLGFRRGRPGRQAGKGRPVVVGPVQTAATLWRDLWEQPKEEGGMGS